MKGEVFSMALVMVHLMVADLWARQHREYLDCPEYYLGAVSPDAIHVRDHDDKSHKDEIHLFNWRSLHREPLKAYWRAHHAPFDIGYGVHVLTDCQWVPRYTERLKGILLPNGRLNTVIYYNDTFVTDFALYRKEPRLQTLLEYLPKAAVPEDHPLLTQYEMDQWRRMMWEAYHGECPKHDPVKFIDEAYVRSFAQDSVPLIEEIYQEVFSC